MLPLDSQLRAIDVEIQHVDCQIAQLELNKLELSRRKAALVGLQNATAPISKVPPEVLVKIFSLVWFSSLELDRFAKDINTSDLADDEALSVSMEKNMLDNALLRPCAFNILHVSHDWRELAIGFQELWSRIQVQLRTAPGLIGLMLTNSGGKPIELDITCQPVDEFRHSMDLRALPMLQGMLGRSLDRFKSIGLYSRAAAFLGVMAGRAENLESLVVMEHNIRKNGLVVNSQFLGGHAPRLRHLELTGIGIPWTSPILNATPHLTHVSIDINPMPVNPQYTAGLIAFLRQAQRLKSLKLYVDFSRGDNDEDLSGDQDPIRLPSLEAFDLHCSHRGSLLTLLSLLQLSKNIPRLAVTTGDGDPDNAERILHFIKSGRSPGEFIAPESLAIDYYKASCWKEQSFHWTGRHTSRGVAYDRLTKTPSLAWQELSVSYERGDLRPNSTAYRLPWSFENLRAISLVCNGNPREYWERLSSLESLEVVHVYGLEQRDLVSAIGAVPTSDPADGHSVQGGDYPVIFRALRAVAFTRFHWDINHEARTSGVAIEDATKRFLEDMAQALGKWGGKLKELKFEDCRDIVPSAECLNGLMPRTDCLVWESRVYLENAESGEAEEV